MQPFFSEVGVITPKITEMGIMRAGVFPRNAIAGQLTTYSADIPTTKKINNDYKIILTFPVGFNVSGAKKDTYSPINNDLNNGTEGVVSFSTDSESSGGANSDGVLVDANARAVTIDLAVSGSTLTKDYIHFDIAGIINTNIPRNLDTGGYNVDIKIMDEAGKLSESINGLPFFINSGGTINLNGSILGINANDVDGIDDNIMIFLSSPMTGPLEKSISIDSNGFGSFNFSGLPAGQYSIFTKPNIIFDGNKYNGNPMPRIINLENSENSQNINLTKENTGSLAQITVNINGVPIGDEVDIFASNKEGLKISTLTSDENTLSTIFYLTSGDWMIGVGPSASYGRETGSYHNSDWISPVPIKLSTDGSTSKSINFNILSADKEIIGYVQDNIGNAVSDAEVYAYQPLSKSKAVHSKTDTNGKFILKLANSGNYSLGLFKQGLLNANTKNIKVLDNTISNDGNLSADIYFNEEIITNTNSLILKVHKSDYTISGKVTNSNQPVVHATVWANKQNGVGQVETISDETGNYILYVDDGAWQVQANIPGYGKSVAQTIVVNGESETQNLYLDDSVDYYLISGNVTIEDNAQANKLIKASQYDINGNFLGQVFNSQTDENGNYSITNVPAGIYRVDVWTSEYGELERNDNDDYSNTLANLNLNSNKTGVNINVDSLNAVTLSFTNGVLAQKAIVKIDGVISGIATGYSKIIELDDLSNDKIIKLANGDYIFSINVPGIGTIEPSTNPVTISGDNTVTFILPDETTDIFTISGLIDDGSSPINEAWVWAVNENTGIYLGDNTDSEGNYSLSLKSGTYKVGVEIPGFLPTTSTQIIIDQDKQVNFSLNVADVYIKGRIYNDVNSNNLFDLGEEISNGWIWVRENTTNKLIGTRAQSDGSFSIAVAEGTYTLKAIADGYTERNFGNISVSDENSINNNISLTAITNWTSNLQSKPIIPSSGGIINDSSEDGIGVKVIAAPNVLGQGVFTVSLKTKEVTNVAKTNSANPLGGIGKEITATDDSGQIITNTNDDLEIELTYYKSDIEAAIADYNKLNEITNSYWDDTVNNWVALTTAKSAFVKNNANETNWTVINYSDFVSSLASSTATYSDYKVVLQSTSNHLTIFSAITPVDSIPPAAPINLTQTAGSGTSLSIDWDDNSEIDVLEYEIYRATSAGVAAIDTNQVNTLQINSSNFTDNTTSDWTSYFYTVTAVDDSGNESAIADEVQVCSNQTLNNGTVAADCVITCESGYDLIGNSCNAQSDSGNESSSGGGDGGSSGGGGSSSTSDSGDDSFSYEVAATTTNTTIEEVLNTDYEEVDDTGIHWTDIYKNQESQDSNNEKVEEFKVATGKNIIFMFKDILERAQSSQMKDFAKKAFEIINFNKISQTDKEFQERIIVMIYEAVLIASGDLGSLLAYNESSRDLEKEKRFISEYGEKLNLEITDENRKFIINIMHFIIYGTKSTLRLGMGERAGVVNSFQSSYKHIPQDEFDWNDLIKIANGRWPTNHSATAEARALINFELVYLRQPNREDPNDDAAMMVMAYGLRPLIRNLDNERTGINTFQYIYDYHPKKATAWDVVRSIANSGATR